jgi:hypothetical protein
MEASSATIVGLSAATAWLITLPSLSIINTIDKTTSKSLDKFKHFSFFAWLITLPFQFKMLPVYDLSWHACSMQKILLPDHGAHGPTATISTQHVCRVFNDLIDDFTKSDFKSFWDDFEIF